VICSHQQSDGNVDSRNLARFSVLIRKSFCWCGNLAHCETKLRYALAPAGLMF
jgi:hypothetical protein